MRSGKCVHILPPLYERPRKRGLSCEPASSRWRRRLIGADDLAALVDDDVVGPVDADVVDLVFAVAQLHNTVDDAAWVRGQRSFRRLIRFRSAGDRPRPLGVVRWDLTDLL